jgi:hypothetical protein
VILRTKFLFALALFFAIGLLTAYACTSKPTVISANTPSTQATPTPTPATPAKLTAEDLKKLRWIEGTWRGTGVSQPAFFERYRWENDTTLAVDSFENEKLEKVTDTTRFELKDGEFGGGSEGALYVATALDDNAITFAPVVKAQLVRLEARVKRLLDGDYQTSREARQTIEGHHLQHGTLA